MNDLSDLGVSRIEMEAGLRTECLSTTDDLYVNIGEEWNAREITCGLLIVSQTRFADKNFASVNNRAIIFIRNDLFKFCREYIDSCQLVSSSRQIGLDEWCEDYAFIFTQQLSHLHLHLGNTIHVYFM